MKSCFICNIELNKNDKKHIYYCAKVRHLQLTKDDLKFKQICHEINHTFSKEEFKSLYEDHYYSLPDFRNQFLLSYNASTFLIKYFNLKFRSLTEAAQSDKRLNQYKKTCIAKYGKDNISKIDSIKDKKKNTFIKNYGVDNIWKSDQFKSWYKKYMNDTYGCGSIPNKFQNTNKWWANQSKEYKEQNAKRLRKGFRNWFDNLSEEDKINLYSQRNLAPNKIGISKLEKDIHAFLSKENIRFKSQFWISRRSYDILIKGTKNIIEINGDYWHANPDIYAPDDIIKYPDRTIAAKERWQEDFEKMKLANKYGYTVFRIWEKDIRENISEVKEFILNSILESNDE